MSSFFLALFSFYTGGGGGKKEINRAKDDRCEANIHLIQGNAQPLPSGIPTFIVRISNICAKNCKISKFHVKCGLFASSKLINPRVFKRIRFDDCLLKNGNAFKSGEVVSFQYANSHAYALSISSAVCEF
ncbi:hypothetical protein MKX03_009329 [Papaver bracteatum]|nr:hypothetical protein MKX03_009329 [Papaver bracteatum]